MEIYYINTDRAAAAATAATKEENKDKDEK